MSERICKRGHVVAGENAWPRSRGGRINLVCKACGVIRMRNWRGAPSDAPIGRWQRTGLAGSDAARFAKRRYKESAKGLIANLRYFKSAKWEETNRRNGARQRGELLDAYIAGLLGIPVSWAGEELIDSKRLQLKVLRFTQRREV